MLDLFLPHHNIGGDREMVKRKCRGLFIEPDTHCPDPDWIGAFALHSGKQEDCEECKRLKAEFDARGGKSAFPESTEEDFYGRF